MQAFRKLDKSGDGVIKVEDMEGVYNVQKHPKYVSGEKGKEEIFKDFLKTFEMSEHPDGIVRYLHADCLRADSALERISCCLQGYLHDEECKEVFCSGDTRRVSQLLRGVERVDRQRHLL